MYTVCLYLQHTDAWVYGGARVVDVLLASKPLLSSDKLRIYWEYAQWFENHSNVVVPVAPAYSSL